MYWVENSCEINKCRGWNKCIGWQIWCKIIKSTCDTNLLRVQKVWGPFKEGNENYNLKKLKRLSLNLGARIFGKSHSLNPETLFYDTNNVKRDLEVPQNPILNKRMGWNNRIGWPFPSILINVGYGIRV